MAIYLPASAEEQDLALDELTPREIVTELDKHVVGQRAAKRAVAIALRNRQRRQKLPPDIADDIMPKNIIMIGPTGVGKTELARTLAEFMFEDENALIRIDMSEYAEKFAVSRLMGAPPGYVGYDEGGQLTEKVRRRPYAVILFDEIEKAHPDVFNILLQVLDDGRLTDSFGRIVDFKNTVVIMTSNLGARSIDKGGSLGFKKQDDKVTYQGMKGKVVDELKKTFNPEFLNRIDEIIVFHQLTKADLTNIIELLISKVAARLKEKKIVLKLDASAKDLLIEKGYDPVFGARPLKRAIQKYIEDPLSMEILNKRITEGCVINAKADNDKLIFVKE